jgi:hypothetical protein
MDEFIRGIDLVLHTLANAFEMMCSLYSMHTKLNGNWGGDETAEVGFGVGRGEEGKDLDVGGEGTALG